MGLILSGITAFPLAWELQVLTQGLGIDASISPEGHNGLSFWLTTATRNFPDTPNDGRFGVVFAQGFRPGLLVER